jgi:hypothetical protein
MTETEEQARPKAVIRRSRSEKRRHRRRKSKYSRPLFSFAHLMALGFAALAAAFVLALFQATQMGGDLALDSARDRSLDDLNLPGAPAGPVARGAGPLQFVIWAYLFGSPVLFAIQRFLLWRRTRNGIRLILYAGMAVWLVIVVVLFALGL